VTATQNISSRGWCLWLYASFAIPYNHRYGTEKSLFLFCFMRICLVSFHSIRH